MSSVSLVKSEGKTGAEIKEAISASLNLIDYKFPSNLKSVTIKPNMCYYWDFSTGQTTDPRFVGALIDLIREQTSSNVDISIIESDASAMRCKYAYKMLGYEKLSKEKNVRLVNLSEDTLQETDVSVDGETLKFNNPKTIQSADLRINVPKIKFMGQTTISCAMKNIFGCNPQVLKYKCHPKINETIVGLNKMMKFDLHILDGLIVSSNPPKRLKLVMSSKDPVAFDATAARILGVNPEKIKHLLLAQKEGLGTLNFVTKGEPWQTFAKEYPKPSFTSKFLVFGYKTALKVHLLNPDSL